MRWCIALRIYGKNQENLHLFFAMLIYHSKPTKAIDLFTDILIFDQQCLKRYGTLHFAKLYKITVEILQKCNEQKIHSYRMIFLDKRKLSIKQLQKKRYSSTPYSFSN